MSIGLMSCSAIAARCASLALMCRIPPCTFGCSVFTRPSSISGNPVSSEISFTATPFSRSNFAVPPVEISSTPRPASLRAKSTSPVLSVTLRRARLIFDMNASVKNGGRGPTEDFKLPDGYLVLNRFSLQLHLAVFQLHRVLHFLAFHVLAKLFRLLLDKTRERFEAARRSRITRRSPRMNHRIVKLAHAVTLRHCAVAPQR